MTATTQPMRDISTLLQIVPVRVHGKDGVHDTYALLDPGSEISFCTEAVLNRLQVTGEKKKIRLQTVGGLEPQKTYTQVKLKISSLDPDEPDEIIVPEALSVSTLDISLPYFTDKQRSKWRHTRDLNIPNYDGGQVELLLGANVIQAVIQQDYRVGQPGQPVAVKTAFGWTLTGNMAKLLPDDHSKVMFSQYPIKQDTTKEGRAWERYKREQGAWQGRYQRMKKEEQQ